MDYNQFMFHMKPGQLTGKESINTLQEFVEEFPYFQTAHLLLAKSMHEQQHVRYEKQLKLAAAYAGDRKSLYNLIHSLKKIISINHTPLIESSFISPPIKEEIITENISQRCNFIRKIGLS